MEDADRNSAIDYEHTGDSLDSVPEVVQSLDAKTVPETALEERDNGTSESVNVAKPPPAARMSMAFDDDEHEEEDDDEASSDALRQDSVQSDDGGEATVVKFTIPSFTLTTFDEEEEENDDSTEASAVSQHTDESAQPDAETPAESAPAVTEDESAKEIVSSVGGNVKIFGAGEKNVAVGIALARKYGKKDAHSDGTDDTHAPACSVSMSWRKDTFLASSLSVSYSEDKVREMEALFDAKHRVDTLTGSTDVSRQAKKLLAEGDLIKVMRLSLVSKAAVAKQRRYILLDNVLLWAGYASKKSKKLVLKGRLDTGEYSVIDLPDQTSHGSSTLTNAFAVNNCAKGKLNVLITHSPEEKSTWLAAFKKCGVRIEDPAP